MKADDLAGIEGKRRTRIGTIGTRHGNAEAHNPDIGAFIDVGVLVDTRDSDDERMLLALLRRRKSWVFW